MDIKEVLKRNHLIYGINAYVKAARVKRDNKSLTESYQRLASQKNLSYREEDVPRHVIERLLSRGKSVTRRSKGAIRVFLVGASQSQDNSGFLQSLREFGEVIAFKNHSGAYGLEVCASPQDTELVSRNSSCLLQQLHTALAAGPIDLLMGQMWANFLSASALKQVGELGIPIVNISMDDRLPNLWGRPDGVLLGAVGLADFTDLVLTTSKDCCIRYLVHDCPSLYWPLASNPDVFRPSEKKDIDVCFIGNKYGIRQALVAGLQKRGIQVQTYGQGWPNGPVGPDESAAIFGRSKIILGIGTVGHTKDYYTLKLRDFDATMSGALYLTHRNPDLLELFEEGREIECYTGISEAASKVSFYLEHPELAADIGQAAAKRARAEHTWEKRISRAFQVLGLM